VHYAKKREKATGTGKGEWEKAGRRENTHAVTRTRAESRHRGEHTHIWQVEAERAQGKREISVESEHRHMSAYTAVNERDSLASLSDVLCEAG